MRQLAFEVVNVFAETTFGGNPLAVFPDARGLSDGELQALTDQFNLAETTFVFPPTKGGTARVRIFTPGYEMDFAGHPTLGTAHVIRGAGGGGDEVHLELNAGVVPVRAAGDRWALTAPPARWREFPGDVSGLEAALGLPAGAVSGPVRFVSTGVEQLVVPVGRVEWLRGVRPDAARLFPLARNDRHKVMVYVVARDAVDHFTVRFFWEQESVGVREDAGTGSACANLGGYLLSTGEVEPVSATVEQGHALGRLNVLSLRLEAGTIQVGGRVVPLMSGVVRLP